MVEMKEEMSLEELKKYVIKDSKLNLSIKEIFGVFSCDNKEYIYKVLKENSAKNENNNIQS